MALTLAGAADVLSLVALLGWMAFVFGGVVMSWALMVVTPARPPLPPASLPPQTARQIRLLRRLALAFTALGVVLGVLAFAMRSGPFSSDLLIVVGLPTILVAQACRLLAERLSRLGRVL